MPASESRREDRLDKQSSADTITAISRKSKIRQVLEIQGVLKGVIMDSESKPIEIASCARSWDLLEERLRILRGKPLPGQLQPGKHAKPSKEPSAIVPQMVPKAA